MTPSFRGVYMIVLLMCVCAFWGGVAPAAARVEAGRLDPAFGVSGMTFSDPGTALTGVGVELGIDGGGSAVVSGAFGGPIVRFEPDGTPDRLFGDDGRLFLDSATASEGLEQLTFFKKGIAVDSLGRTLVFGEQTDAREVFMSDFAGEIGARSAVVLRFTDEGEPDAGFGDGKGFVRGDFGLGSGLETDVPMVGIMAGRVDSLDRPEFVAGVLAMVSGCYGHGGLGKVPRAVVRLTESGEADPGFGDGDGVSLISGSAPFPGFGIDAAGDTTVGAGRTGGPEAICKPGTTLYRLGADGERDSGFGTAGVRVSKRANLSLVQPSGQLILSRRRGQTLTLIRLRADGTRDPKFGPGGLVEVSLPDRIDLHVKPVAVDSRGRVLLGGFVGSVTGEPVKGQGRSSFVLARLKPGGTIDRSFGKDGWVMSPLPGRLEATAAAAALDSQGHLLVAATVIRPYHREGVFAVARYLLDHA